MGGDAVGTHPSGRVALLNQGYPGETVEAVVTESKPRLVRAKVISVREPIVDTEERCAVFGRCGGCRFWGPSYKDELAWKSTAVLEGIRRLDRNLVWPAPRIEAAPRKNGYRLRAKFHLMGRGQTGFLEQGSHQGVPSTQCAVLMPALDEVRLLLGGSAQGLPHESMLHVEWDDQRQAVAALVEVPYKALDKAKEWGAELAKQFGSGERISTLKIQTLPDAKGFAKIRERFIWGDGMVGVHVPLTAHTILVWIPVGSFRQGSRDMSQKLRQEVATLAGAMDARALDLYAGYGNFSVVLASMGWEVDAVEGSGPASDAGKLLASSLRQSGVAQVRMFAQDLNEGLPKPVMSRISEYRLAVVDPPRGGLSRAIVSALSASEIRRIIYVSCDPAAMARDAMLLAKAGFGVHAWTLFDTFPRTAHMEAVALFTRTQPA